ncbi:MAG: DNA polymerase III subunit alpha [Candidatus Aminicenantes bacterium]|nr:DNA polymerase III subunit alpha [Candidatus Aminicenantes bacterium]
MFVPLRVHSVYSKGKGSVLLSELASWVKKRGVSAACLSDRGVFYGWGRWRKAACQNRVTPLFGCELTVQKKTLLFVVKDRTGYWNLMEIFNRRKIKDVQGLVVVYIPQVEEREFPEELRAMAGPDFYLGADFKNLKKVMHRAGEDSLPVVWANPLKFIERPERLILVRCIHKKIPFPPEWAKWKPQMKFFGPHQEELAQKKFGTDVHKVFNRTFEIAEKCRFTLERIVPALPRDLFPDSFRDMIMRKMQSTKSLNWRERQRARMELDAVEKSGFGPYFQVVHDVVDFARRKGILCNLKGSGASSYLAYLLGISRINPVDFDLYFARFLNPGRKDPPDFDLDFDSRYRDLVLEYVMETYGQGNTGAAFVCSVKNYRARSAVYETARAFGLPPGESRALSKRTPYFAEPVYLSKHLSPLGCKEIWKAASTLTSVFCESSLHVGGIILTPPPVHRYLPLGESAKGLLMCHYDRDAVEDLKLIKLDLLSVRGLAAISGAKKQLGLRKMPWNDKKSFSFLSRSQTIGCFQVESPAMMNLLSQMKPEDIYELTQALALIRPGPTQSGTKQAVLKARQGQPLACDPLLARILSETKGLLLYEEQVMQVAERVAGMNSEEGDLLRRILKKKRRDHPLRVRFFEGARNRGYTRMETTKIWNHIERFSSYSFNKAHSASYACMAYQSVYLKAHHPLPYLTAVLNAGGGYYGLPVYVEEARRMGIEVLPPDVTRSGFRFTKEGTCIRVGLLSIKHLNTKTAQKIIEERSRGSYRCLEDFLIRVSMTKSELFSLIKAGALDPLEPQRTEQILNYYRGTKGIHRVGDLEETQKKKMQLDVLGFDLNGDCLSLFKGNRPELRIKDLPQKVGQTAELVVRVMDARKKRIRGGFTYFFLFSDETGVIEGVGEKKCVSLGSPPACCVRGKIQRNGIGRVKIFHCTFGSSGGLKRL